MAYLEIEKVVGREILDSRGNPTIEAEVWLCLLYTSPSPRDA